MFILIYAAAILYSLVLATLFSGIVYKCFDVFDEWRVTKYFPEFFNFFAVALVTGVLILMIYHWLLWPYAMMGISLPDL